MAQTIGLLMLALLCTPVTITPVRLQQRLHSNRSRVFNRRTDKGVRSENATVVTKAFSPPATAAELKEQAEASLKSVLVSDNDLDILLAIHAAKEAKVSNDPLFADAKKRLQKLDEAEKFFTLVVPPLNFNWKEIDGVVRVTVVHPWSKEEEQGMRHFMRMLLPTWGPLELEKFREDIKAGTPVKVLFANEAAFDAHYDAAMFEILGAEGTGAASKAAPSAKGEKEAVSDTLPYPVLPDAEYTLGRPVIVYSGFGVASGTVPILSQITKFAGTKVQLQSSIGTPPASESTMNFPSKFIRQVPDDFGCCCKAQDVNTCYQCIESSSCNDLYPIPCTGLQCGVVSQKDWILKFLTEKEPVMFPGFTTGKAA